MTETFAMISPLHKSVLLILLFLTGMEPLYIMIRGDAKGRKYIRLLAAALLAVFYFLLSDIGGIRYESAGRTALADDIPVCVLWGLVALTNAALLLYAADLSKTKEESITARTIKEGFDTLSDGVCYFQANGIMKLCNRKMQDIFRDAAGIDLQSYDELSSIIPEDGVVGAIGRKWKYRMRPIKLDEAEYTETILTDVTELMELRHELFTETKELAAMSEELKVLSRGSRELMKEREILNGKMRLHDQMGIGLAAVRRLYRDEECTDGLLTLKKAVDALAGQSDEAPADNVSEILRDTQTLGVGTSISGDFPENAEVSSLFVLAIREFISNGLRHADLHSVTAVISEDETCWALEVRSDETVTASDIIPAGGLLNIRQKAESLRGRMTIQGQPVLTVILTIPKQ